MTAVSTPSTPAVRSEVNELTLLFDISRILDSSLNLRDVVHPVLEALGHHMQIRLGVLSLVNRTTERISIEAAYGLSASQQRRGLYKIGEGVTGRVIQSGEPAVVRKIADEPGMVHRTGAASNPQLAELSFICVPIKSGNSVIGSLSTDKLFPPRTPFSEDVRLLSIIASMISRGSSLCWMSADTMSMPRRPTSGK